MAEVRHYPIRDYTVRVFLKPLHSIDISVVCDESEISDKVREYTDDIISNAVAQIKEQLEDINIGAGLGVVDTQPANSMDIE
jgi:hypothetical protein